MKVTTMNVLLPTRFLQSALVNRDAELVRDRWFTSDGQRLGLCDELFADDR